jgi:hypothetical protein
VKNIVAGMGLASEPSNPGGFCTPIVNIPEFQAILKGGG